MNARPLFLSALFILGCALSGCSKEEDTVRTENQPQDTTNTHMPDTTQQDTLPTEGPDTVTIRYLALGDSYTIGERVDEPFRWPNQLAVQLENLSTDSNTIEVNVDIIAQTGWTSDELLSALDAQQPGNDYDLVSLLIGVNNQYRGRPVSSFIPEFETLLNRAVNYASGDDQRIVVVSIPNYGYTTFGVPNQQQITQELEVYNTAIDSICRIRNLPFINITDISELGLDQPDLVASDGLHPSGVQYGLWVERIEPFVLERLRLRFDL